MKLPTNYSLTVIHVNVWKTYSNTWNHLTVCKQKMSSDSFKNLIKKMRLQIHIYLIYKYKEDLVLNNLH